MNKIYIADDDKAVLDALKLSFNVEGYQVSTFVNGKELTHSLLKTKPDCMILDIHMPEKTGLDILKFVKEIGHSNKYPIFMISGRGSIPIVVKAMKNGAYDFIEKPFDNEDLLSRIADAISVFQSDKLETQELDFSQKTFQGRELLTKRELQVLEQITKGLSNREVGNILEISSRTVEVHRARIMDKLNTRNAADLVRTVLS